MNSKQVAVVVSALALFTSGVFTGASGALLFANRSFHQKINKEVKRRIGTGFKEKIADRLELDESQKQQLDIAIERALTDSQDLRLLIRGKFLKALDDVRPHLSEDQQKALNQIQRRAAVGRPPEKED